MAIQVSSMRPGVFSDYTVSSVYHTSVRGTVALVFSMQTPPQDFVEATRPSDVSAVFGAQGTLFYTAAFLFANGVQKVYCCAVDAAQTPLADAYTLAFGRLAQIDGISCVVCDQAQEQQIVSALKSHVETCSANRRERIGFMGLTKDGYSDYAAIASAANSERVCFAAPELQLLSEHTPRAEYAAAAYAAICATSQDPSESLNAASVNGVSAIANSFTDAEVDHCIASGVTPFEMPGQTCELIRAVTSRTTTQGVADKTFQSIGTIRVIDDCMQTIRNVLKIRLAGAKNNAITRESIRSQVTVELQKKLDLGLIEQFDVPIVSQSEQDPSICLVELGFRVCHSINQIHISAQITV